MKGVVDGIGPDDKVVLWGGGIYNWFDPVTLIRAVHLVRRTVPEIRLYFLGLAHPNPEVPAMSRVSETIALASRLDLVGSHVFFNDGWVPYTERGNYLLEADVGVSTHFDHVETAFSFRTRVLDYLWAGLPIVTTAGDYFGDLVATERLGAAVPAGDVESLAGALAGLLTDGRLAKEARSRSLEVGRRFIWGEAMRPLLEFCRNPARAPDLVDTEQAQLLGVGFTPRRPPRGVIDNLHLVLDYWAAGGLRLVVSKIGSRLRSSATSRRSD
jgi:glycosyltransferase involved in cell wall biosynthesis